MNPILREEFAHAINGVQGRMFAVTARENEAPGAFCKQTWGASRDFRENGQRFVCSVEMRFDDDCRNGHNTFHITGEIKDPSVKVTRYNDGIVSCGSIHDDIARRFPELAGFIKWHGTSTDAPLHYVANAVYLAGDRDCRGLRKGEKREVRTRDGQIRWSLEAVTSSGESVALYLLKKDAVGDDAPPTPTLQWVRTYTTGEGKERELDLARSAAVWPEATDEELMQEPEALRAQLLARLPGLQAAFKADMLGAGFLWMREEVPA